MAGIYRNQTEGIISLSSDGTTRITIADKNLGATQVYNDGDTLSEANAGKYYQWGNNYGFAWTGTVTNASTQVNANTYGPGNYYNNSIFRIINESWDSSNNFNLWGGTTGTNEAMQGPCDTGFHIPLSTEWNTIVTIMTGWSKNTTANWKSLLHFPMAGYRNYYDASLVRQNSYGYYWSNSIYSGTYISTMSFDGSPRFAGQFRSSGYSIRPFKNEAVQPDRTWTKLYGDDILPPFLKWFIKNGNYYYFGDAPIHISGLALDKSSISLTTVGQTEQLTATISPEGAVETKVVWSSSDTSIATVDQTGLVTCVTPGECTITATCGGYSASCSVQSLPIPTSGCVAYFPFEDDTLDKVSNKTFTVTQSGISLSTLDGVKALYNNGSGLSNINMGFRTQDVTSMLFWFRFVSGSDAAVLGERSTSGGDCDRIVYNRPFSPYGYAYSRYPGTYIQPGNGFPESWLCFGIIETSSGSTMYVNGTNVGTVSGAEAFSNLTGNVGILCRYNNGSYERPICGYLSKLAFFNAELSEQDYLDFYNKTKEDYGIS